MFQPQKEVSRKMQDTASGTLELPFGRGGGSFARTFGDKGPCLRRRGFFVCLKHQYPITNNSSPLDKGIQSAHVVIVLINWRKQRKLYEKAQSELHE